MARTRCAQPNVRLGSILSLIDTLTTIGGEDLLQSPFSLTTIGSFSGSVVIERYSSQSSNKRESYRGSVYAPRVLTDHNFTVVLQVRIPRFV